MLLNVTDKVNAERKLTSRMDYIMHIYKTLENSFWGSDTVNNQMLYVSPGNAKVYGHSEEEFMNDGMLWFKVIVDEDKHLFDDVYPRINKGESVVAQYRINHGDKSVRWLETHMTPTMDENGKMIRLDGISIDITDRKTN